MRTGIECQVALSTPVLSPRSGRRQGVRAIRAAAIAAAAAAGLLGPVAASDAVDHLWVATTPSDYNVATNWAPATVPGSGDNAVVENGGAVLIQAGDPAWTVFDVRAGDNDAGNTGNGTYVQTGSTVTANSWFRLGADTAGVTGTYNMSGGTFVGHGNVRVGETGTGFLNLSGTANFSADGSMNGTYWAVGANSGSVGYMNVAGTAVVNDNAGNDSAPIQVAASTGATGTLTLSGNATINTNSNELWVGQNGTGTFNQSGGTLNVGNWIAVGRQGGTGVWNLTGGVVNKTGGGNISISGDGAPELGIVNQAGGVVNNTASDTYIGDGSVGAWNLSGGTANFSETDLGRNTGAAGTVNLTGGVMNAAVANGQFAVGYAAGATGVLNVTAGTLNVGTTANASTGTLAVGQSGTGTLNLSGTGTINATNVYAAQKDSSVGVINASGGTLNAATVSVGAEVIGGGGTSAGTFNVSGSAVVNATSLYVGKSGPGTATFTMAGGTVNVAQLARGSATGTVAVNLNGGTLTSSTGADNPSFVTGFHAGEVRVNGVTINTGSHTLGITSPLSGTGFTKAGSGVLTLNGTSNPSTMTGTVTIAAGTLRLAAPAPVIPASTVVGFYPMTPSTTFNGYNGIPNVVQDTNPAANTNTSNDLTVAGGTVAATTLAPPGAGHSGSLAYSNQGFLQYAYGAPPSGGPPAPAGLPVGNSAYTFGAWINLSTAPNNGSSGAGAANNGLNGIVGYGAYGANGGNDTNAFRTGYYGGPNGITNYWYGMDGQAPNPNNSLTGNWHYVATTYDPTAGSATGGLGVRTMYIDGTVVDSEDPNVLLASTALNFAVGDTNPNAVQKGQVPEYFSGNMADLIIANTAYTPVQLAAAAAGDNPFALNSSAGQLSVTSAVNVSSGATLDLNGQNQTLAGLSGTGAVTLGAGTLTINDAVATEFDGTISGAGGLTKGGTGTFSVGSPAGSLTFTGVTTVNAGTLAFLTPAGATGRSVRTLAGGVVINGGTLSLPVAATSATRTVLVTPSITFATTGTPAAFAGRLDVGNGDVDVKTASAATAVTTLATLNAAAASGFNGGTQTGTGLASAAAAADAKHLTAVGVIQNATTIGGTTPIYTSFDGQTVSTADVLVRDTYYGDTNLDGVVNAADYLRVDNGFVMKLTGWQNGDFNYDGVVDGSDYTLMDNAFNQQGGNVASPAVLVASAAAQVAGGTSAVPEPATSGLLALGLAGLVGRRRRRSPASGA